MLLISMKELEEEIAKIKIKNDYLEEQLNKLEKENNEYKLIILKYSEKLSKRDKKIKELENKIHLLQYKSTSE